MFKKEKFFVLSLIKTIQHIKPALARPRRDELLRKVLDHFQLDRDRGQDPLSHFAVREPHVVRLLQHYLGIRLLVVQKKLKCTYKLLYDGRHALWDSHDEEMPPPLHCFLLDRKDKLIMETDSIDCLPTLHIDNFVAKMYKTVEPLWKLLKYQPPSIEWTLPSPSPQSLHELRDYVNRYTAPHCKVVVKFKCGVQRTSPLVTWFDNPKPANVQDVIYIVAVADQKYQLQYLLEPEADDAAARRRGEKIVQDYERYQALWEELENPDKMTADPYQSNCASAVSVQHSGLNLLHDLGLTTLEERAHLSQELALTCSSLYVFLDEQHHLRHITYYDREESFSAAVPCFEADNVKTEDMTDKQYDYNEKCRDEACQIMMDFWQKVWQRRLYWVEKRTALLQPWISGLQALLAFPSGFTLTSPVLRCLKDLKKTTMMHHVVMYSKEDSHLHAIKFFLSHYAHQTFKHCRGVSIKAQSDDTLAKLSISGLTIVNAYIYFYCNKDSDFFSKLWNPWKGPQPCDVVISHAVQSFKKQPRVNTGLGICGVGAYCNERGLIFARYICQNWQTFGQFLLDTFEFEVFGQATLPSASYLAFQCIWSLYAQKAGPFVQSLERCKPYYEHLLRQSSRGGFMFSAETLLAQGDALFPKGTDDAKADAITEYDLISAYGVSAASSHLPSGFCTGFKRVDEQESLGVNKLDHRARHKSFEFMAVYQTIHDLTRQGWQIQSLYHNYSPLGVFTLGKYNLDLVVVSATGDWMFYNMDSHFVHSCPVCPSANKRFIGKQTHEQVREKSMLRDVAIRAWVDGINAIGRVRAQYIVIYDCHTAGYLPGTLQRSFQTDSTLASLVQGYKIIDASGSFFTPKTFQQNILRHPQSDYTFIARARVCIKPETALQDPLQFGPLIIYPNDASSGVGGNHNDKIGDDVACVLQKSSSQRLDWKGTIALTRDYYQWLDATFSDCFHLEQLEWVLFYKTEPTLNDIYQSMVQLRAKTTDAALVSFIKRLINLSCGFFGARASQRNKTTYRLVNKMPKNYAFYRHSADAQRGVDLDNDTYFLLETKPFPKIPREPLPSKSALAIFFTVVETGKLRLVQILHFLWRHLQSGHYRLLYSNIDNVILALAGPDLNAVVDPRRRDDFDAHVDEFIARPGEKTPGMAELKWTRSGLDSEWQFITIRIQHYCLKANREQDNLHKTSGWSNISTDRAFASALDILQGRGAIVPQIRRIHKIEGMSTQSVFLRH